MGWKEVMEERLIAICKAEGVAEFDAPKVLGILQRLADEDRPKPTKQRVGFAYVFDNYKDRTMKGFLNGLQSQWTAAPTPEASSPQNKTTHPYATAMCLKLRGGAFTSRIPADLVKQFHGDIFGETLFGASVVDAAFIKEDWWDLRVEYSMPLEDLFAKVLEHPWVEDGFVKPVVDFGREKAPGAD